MLPLTLGNLVALAAWPPWLLRMLGIRFTAVDRQSPAELVWTNLPTSWAAFAFLACVAAALYAVSALYRRESASCPPWGKVLLTALRSASVVALAVVVMRPAIVLVQHRTIRPKLVILRDASQSMNATDESTGNESLSRVTAVNQAFASTQLNLLDHLAAKGDLVWVDFSSQATTLPQPAPLVATGRETNLAAAVRHALPPASTHLPSSSPSGSILPGSLPADVSAIVLITDGQHTTADDPQAAAREAQRLHVPIYTVGVGDSTHRLNVAVTSVSSLPKVWKDEPFEIEAILQFQGAPPGPLVLELLELPAATATADTSGIVVQTRQIPIDSSAEGGQLTASFSHLATGAGNFIYRVRIQPPPGDARATDDQADSNLVQVHSRDQIRVLLVAGAPSWDYRLVQKLLARDASIQLSCWLQSLAPDRAQDGTLPIPSLPSTKAELFAYDVILLFDPDPAQFPADWGKLLSEFVGQHGGGLLLAAGSKYTGQLLTTPAMADLSRLLPVQFGDLEARQVAALLAKSSQAWPVKVHPGSGDHPLLQFFPDRDRTLRQWQALPGVFWSFPTQGARPTAQVLLELSDPTLAATSSGRPLLATGRFGAGLTIFMGTEETWRWRKAGRNAEFFDKFWVQVVRYLLAGRTQEGQNRSRLQADRDHYEVGQPIEVTAKLLDEHYEALPAPSIAVTLEVAGQSTETITLLPVPNRPGEFAATTTASRAGLHQLRLQSSLTGEGPIQTSFQVELPSAETRHSGQNQPILEELASLSGGRYFPLSQIAELAAAIPAASKTKEVRTAPQPIWDNEFVLALLVALLASEWLLRKRFQLL